MVTVHGASIYVMDKFEVNDFGKGNGMGKKEVSEGQATPNFEQIVGRIEEIVRSLEKGDAALDESLSLFEEGAGLIKKAGKILDDAEQVVVKLQKGADGEPKEYIFDEE